jgi:tRNA-2-methylthio-N6-dimethylallyladenosine synthase
MNRKYTIESYMDKVSTLRRFRPDIALATDIIVGFPGETEADFQATLDLLSAVRFHGSFSFKYSDRPRTPSADFDDKIPEVVKSRRLKEFQNLQDLIGLERNIEYIGQVVEVMIEDNDGDDCKGRTPTNQMVHFSNQGQLFAPGDLAMVKIDQAGKHSLKGNLYKQD